MKVQNIHGFGVLIYTCGNGSISKILGVVVCFTLHLQEGDAFSEIRYAYSSTLCHAIPEHMWSWEKGEFYL